MNAEDAFRPVNLSQSEPFRWQGLTEHIYKADSEISSFKDVTRRKLFIDPD